MQEWGWECVCKIKKRQSRICYDNPIEHKSIWWKKMIFIFSYALLLKSIRTIDRRMWCNGYYVDCKDGVPHRSLVPFLLVFVVALILRNIRRCNLPVFKVNKDILMKGNSIGLSGLSFIFMVKFWSLESKLSIAL